jgi:hypothetical protein
MSESKHYFRPGEPVRVADNGPKTIQGAQGIVAKVKGKVVHIWILGTEMGQWVPVNSHFLQSVGEPDPHRIPSPPQGKMGPMRQPLSMPNHNIHPATFGAPPPPNPIVGSPAEMMEYAKGLQAQA